MNYYSKSNRVSEQLLADLQSGNYGDDGYLPSDSVLADYYNVSRLTLRRALDILIDNGHLVRDPSRGVRPARHSSSPAADAVALPAKTIGVAWFAWEDAFTLNIRSGIREYAEQNNLQLRYFFNHQRHEPVLRFFSEARQHGLDGLITLPYQDASYERTLRELTQKGFPVVCVDRGLANLELNTVTADNIGGAYEATRRLLMRRQQPVWFFGQPKEASSNMARYTGYVQAMTEAGYGAACPSMVIATSNLVESAEHWPCESPTELAERFLATHAEIERFSILACNDYLADALYKAAARFDRKVGRDLFVCGFDDLPLAAELSPPLTTVRQPRRELGFEAAALLHKAMNGAINGPVTVSLPVSLISRNSD